LHPRTRLFLCEQRNTCACPAASSLLGNRALLENRDNVQICDQPYKTRTKSRGRQVLIRSIRRRKVCVRPLPFTWPRFRFGVNKSIYDGHYALYRELFLLGCAFLKYASQIQLQNSMEQRPCAKRSLGASGLAIRWWNSIWKRADACEGSIPTCGKRISGWDVLWRTSCCVLLPVVSRPQSPMWRER